MDVISSIFTTAVIPGMFTVAARTWGIEVAHIALIPISFSVLLLCLAILGCIQKGIMYNHKARLLWFGLLILVFGILLLQLFQWNIWRGTENTSSAPTSLVPIFALEFILLVFVGVLLGFVRFFTRPALLVHGFLAFIFALTALFVLWKLSMDVPANKLIVFTAESLLVTALAFITLAAGYAPKDKPLSF